MIGLYVLFSSVSPQHHTWLKQGTQLRSVQVREEREEGEGGEGGEGKVALTIT